MKSCFLSWLYNVIYTMLSVCVYIAAHMSFKLMQTSWKVLISEVGSILVCYGAFLFKSNLLQRSTLMGRIGAKNERACFPLLLFCTHWAVLKGPNSSCQRKMPMKGPEIKLQVICKLIEACLILGM